MAKKVAEEVTEQAAVETPKKRKRLKKIIDGTVLSITEGDTETTTDYDFSTLPEAIQALLGPFGMSQKLGDAAAGKRGQEAVDAINKVWTGLSEGNWSVRAPKAEKITKKGLTSRLDALPEAEKGAALKALEALGIKL